MSNVNLKRFVDINIKQHVSSIITGTRDVVALFTSEAAQGVQDKTIISSLTEANLVCKNMPLTLKYLTAFFNNSGTKVMLNTKAISADNVAALDNEIIVVASVITDNSNDNYEAIKEIATIRNADASIYGINEKLLIANLNNDAIPEDSVKNMIVKSCQAGDEMSIAAYLSKINVYGVDTVYDYAFTAETVEPQDITDTVYENLITNNINVNIYLAGASRNCGGNCKDGADVTNSYVRIILHQTLTEQLIRLLSTKLKNTDGVNKIYSAVVQELERYRQSGYLTTDKIWTDESMVVTYNNQSFTIIEKGSTLPSGYTVKVLPMSALTDGDKAERKAPPIYVILADQYGIRMLVISGEII